MKLCEVNPLLAGLAAVLFLLGGAASVLGLGLMARPEDFAARVANAASQPVTATGSAGSQRFATGAVCSQATIPASQALHGALTDLASRHTLTLETLQVAPAAPDRALQGLSAIDVQLAGTASQADAVALIADLERSSPVVFVDGLELRPKGGAFALTLTGRAFCAIPARS